jgi:hypothetical protein
LPFSFLRKQKKRNRKGKDKTRKAGEKELKTKKRKAPLLLFLLYFFQIQIAEDSFPDGGWGGLSRRRSTVIRCVHQVYFDF